MRKPPPSFTDLDFLLHRAATLLLRGKRALDSLFFPRTCPGCAVALPYPDCICRQCSDALPRIRAPFCRRCGAPFPDFWRVTVCAECRMARPPLTRLRSCFLYEGLVRQMIREAKYRHAARMLRYFSGELYVRARSEFPARVRAIVPVPLHHEREWTRTYNQSFLMAHDLSLWWNRPLWTGLRRVRRTPPQSGLSGLARRRNLKNAFAVTGPAPRSVLLVDDVVTTGATLEACARMLRSAGARRVYAITIARAVKVRSPA